jgi:hypothetical protein
MPADTYITDDVLFVDVTRVAMGDLRVGRPTLTITG